MKRLAIRVAGMVQGVGFRPFVYRLAQKYALTGWVKNDGGGVMIEAEGDDAALDSFCTALIEQAPPLAAIAALTSQVIKPVGETGFIIADSDAALPPVTLLPPDLATCPACQQELLNPADRRYRYPFINCTECGPRYTIVRSLPYDRPATTMAGFALCPACRQEYLEPGDRRFHAQPNACAKCGPQYLLLDAAGKAVDAAADVFNYTRQLIAAGAIVAIKGVGGWHLACNARDKSAVDKLRLRKGRQAKPFAVMVGSLQTVRRLCRVSDAEADWLTSRQRPIVLLAKGDAYDLVESVAPDNDYLGVMLPYAPLHWLLLAPDDVWVMTSGNLSTEPIAYGSAEALWQAGLAEYYLEHNRPIERPAEDSVLKIADGAPLFIRRSRGFVPAPIRLRRSESAMLAVGGDLKNAFCLTRAKDCIISAHNGDLSSLAAFERYSRLIREYQQLFNIEPSLVVHDLHPGYWSTRYALVCGLPRLAVQHHHAHIAAIMAEHNLHIPVIGVAFDGTGYGTDGAIWGGEFLLVDQTGFKRAAHFAYLPLPGGEQAIWEPWRLACWLLAKLYGSQAEMRQAGLAAALPNGWQTVAALPAKGIHSPLTSSVGRLFDAAAALINRAFYNQFEGHAAITLEHLAGKRQGWVLPYRLCEEEPLKIDFLPTFAALLAAAGSCEPAELAAAFHDTVTDVVVRVTLRLAEASGVRAVALGGGVWQNGRLLASTVPRLRKAGLQVYLPQQVPVNDGGLCLGQAYIAMCQEGGHYVSGSSSTSD